MYNLYQFIRNLSQIQPFTYDEVSDANFKLQFYTIDLIKMTFYQN
jgi:hypothetical protein